MEVLGIIILSALAFYGIFLTLSDMLKQKLPRGSDRGFKIILAIPDKAQDTVEGVVRGVFLEKIPEKLLTDSKLYVVVPEGNQEIVRILGDLKKTYPIEMLPPGGRYCMITGGSTRS